MLKFVFQTARHYCTKTPTKKFEEVKIPVPWGHVSGKWWAPFDKRPILTIHGWQDNCGSFDRLIPHLTPDVGFLAIDLPGHGYSSRLPAGMYYNNINYPILIRSISQYFNWLRVSLMGHSLGGISCYTYTMLFPESVDFLISIDGLKPLIKTANAQRMGEGIDEHLKYDQFAADPTEPPSYKLDDIKRKIAQFNKNSIDYNFADVILKRNVARSKIDPEKYYITRDPRLKSRLILNWPQSELIEFAKRVTCPLLIFKAKQSDYFGDKESMYEVLEELKKSSVDCRYIYVDGTHHVHLNHPENISGDINAFIGTYLDAEREAGMLLECHEVLVK